MRLSILDQSPISAGQTAYEALNQSLKLAQAAEQFGYTRYWLTEHHDLPGIACSAPEVMISYIGAHTQRIRIGSGAVLLPHYKPYKVAEIFNMLATLFPDRIDIGIGRAPGGSAEATNALSDNFLQSVYDYPQLVDELVHFLNNAHATLKAAPIPDVSPIPWMLGTSKKSAVLAAEKGMSYAFGQFMSNVDGAPILEAYRSAFRSNVKGEKNQVLLTVSAFCADTAERAEEIALSSLIWHLQTEKGGGQYIPSIEQAKDFQLDKQDKEKLQKMKQNMVIGDPMHLKKALLDMQKQYQADEIMILTTAHSLEDRIHSYQLIADAIGVKQT
ncbi:LLM class flavin-dependent oxidoreductase [Virgibacillus halophilus]|uniref:LLM class flavin-dependent oxidoreductase n=1 Tax=Tigheibacillus halophilus TaxID=361280 RepID=A0ABU5C9B2_9BACI|nr:LLM class flavin-dependent oxidoreductase [Virgibacillus halophilus]